MKLSIIVPVYNMAENNKLDFCIKSLLAQTFQDYEIIVVDDKSTDDSLEELKQYEKKYPDKIKVIASPNNRRAGGAKNLGLRAASGEWLGFVDCKDWISPDCYEKLFAKAEETCADIVGCNYCIKSTQDFEPGEVSKSHYANLNGDMTEDKYREVILWSDNMDIKIYKRSIFYDNGIWFSEYMFYEDNSAGVLSMLYCKHYAHVDEPLYYCYQNSEFMEQCANTQKCNDSLKSMEMLLAECYKRGFLEEYPEELEYRFTEKFYINTLFMYMHQVPFFKRRASYVRLIRDGIMAYYPEYASNGYFEERQDAETKRLVEMHCKSPFRFFWYYTVLVICRKVRKR